MRVEYSVCGRHATEEPRQTLRLSSYDNRMNWSRVDIHPSNMSVWLSLLEYRQWFFPVRLRNSENGINNLIYPPFKR
jgi:hypothetical protein